jgi:hypothetical protein
MKQLTVRNVSDPLAKSLDSERKRRGQSLNQTVLELLSRALGLTPEVRYTNGLEKLAGTWSEEDLKEFEANTACFEQVDPEMWS